MSFVKGTLSDQNRKTLKDMYCGIMGSILRRNRLTHTGLSELLKARGAGEYKKNTIASYTKCKPLEIPLCFIDSLKNGKLCNDKEYEFLARIIFLYNDSVTIDLQEMRKPVGNVEEFMTVFSSILANKPFFLKNYNDSGVENEDKIVSILTSDFGKLYCD